MSHHDDAGSMFAPYRRKQIAELRPYVYGESLTGVSISQADREAGSPLLGDMIARNPKNHADQWLVAAQYFADNFEPVALTGAAPASAPPPERAREIVGWLREADCLLAFASERAIATLTGKLAAEQTLATIYQQGEAASAPPHCGKCGEPHSGECPYTAASAPPEGIAPLQSCAHSFGEWCQVCIDGIVRDYNQERAKNRALSSQLEASQKERDELEARRAKLESAFIEENKLADSLLSQLEKTEAQLEASQKELQALKDYLESCLCGECGGSGITDNHVTGKTECPSCLGTGHDSMKAFAQLEASQRREAALREALEAHGKHPETCPKGTGVGYYKPPANAVCDCGIDSALAEKDHGQ